MALSRLGRVASLLALAARVNAQSQINSIVGSYGSLEGGTYVTVFGDGFSRAGLDGQTRVFMGNDECAVVAYDSTDTKVACYTPAHAYDDTVTVTVAVLDINSQSVFASCSGSACTYYYRAAQTPSIAFMSLGGAAGKTFKAAGVLLGESTTQYQIMLGGSSCSVDPDDYANPDAILDGVLGGGSGVVRCAINDNEAGRYNISYRVLGDGTPHNGFGGASLGARTLQVDPTTGNLFAYTAHPHIGALSYGVTGLGGGSPLTITGAGFAVNPASNVVTVAGQPCAVLTSSTQQIVCVPGPAPAPVLVNASAPTALYPGGRGLLHNVWNGLLSWDGNPINALPDIAYVNSEGLLGYYYNEAANYVEELSGFFVPPVTANYSFQLRADDWAELWLSTNSSAAGERSIALCPSFVTTFNSFPSQSSAPVLLTAGRSYWTRVRHTQGSGQGYFEVALRIHTGGNPSPAAAALTSEAQRVYQSFPEVQEVAITTVVVREVQSFIVAGAAGGAFTLTVGGALSTDAQGNTLSLPYDASPGDVHSFLGGIAGCNNVGVTGAPVAGVGPAGASGTLWNVTIGCPTDAGSWPAVVPYSLSLVPALGQPSAFLTSWRAVAASAPASGTFRLSLGGVTIATDLPARTGGAAIAAALQALPGITSVEVTDSTTNAMDGGSWLVTFWGPYGPQPLLAPVTVNPVFPNASTLAGANVSIATAELWEGSTDPWFWPAPMDYFQTALAAPPVTVVSNGILGDCDLTTFAPGNPGASPCVFQYSSALTATLTGVDKTNVTAGATLTITGANFVPLAAGVGLAPGGGNLPPWALNTVLLNGSSFCNVTSATVNVLTCVVGDAAAGTYALSVQGAYGRGLAVGAAPSVTFTARLDSASPLSGSSAGGTVLTLAGTGFQPSAAANVITIGGVPCAPLSSSFTAIACVTPPLGAGAPASAPLLINGVPFPSNFTYDPTRTAQVTALWPGALSAAISGTIRVSLANLGAWGPAPLLPANLSISFGGRACALVNVTSLGGAGTYQAACTLVRGAVAPLPQTPLPPAVTVGNWGAASLAPGLPGLNAAYRVDSLSTASGSLEGGTVITLFGAGFSTLPYQVEPAFNYADGWGYQWSIPCGVVSLAPDGSNATCILSDIPMWQRGPANSTTALVGALVLRVNNVTAPCGPATSGCAYSQNIGSTPVVATQASDAVNLYLTGTNMDLGAGSRTHVSIGPYPCAPLTVLVAGNATNGGQATVACPLPMGTAGTYAVNVTVDGLGAARINSTYSFGLVLGALSAARGSAEGGAPLTITGTGFATADITQNLVSFGGAGYGVVVGATPTSLSLLTPPSHTTTGSGAATVDVTVYVVGEDGWSTYAALPASYTFDASAAFTPKLTSLSPPGGFAGMQLVLHGAGFGSGNASAPNVSVVVGGEPCMLSAPNNDTVITCVLGSTPGGTHRVMVTVGTLGLARTSPTASSPLLFTAGLEVDGVAGAAPASLGGGRLVTLTGRGFPPPDSLASVLIGTCNTACAVLASTYTSALCTTGPLVTPAALTLFNVWAPSVLLPTGGLIPDTPAAAAAVDGNILSPFTACTVTLDLGVPNRAVVTSVRYYPTYGASLNLVGATFSGSPDFATWTPIVTLGAMPQQGWNEVYAPGWLPANTTSIDLGAFPTFRYLRFAFAPGATCKASEIEFRGVPVAAAAAPPPDASGYTVCPLNVSVTGPFTPAHSLTGYPAPATLLAAKGGGGLNVTYGLFGTPMVTSVFPQIGTSLGGDTVTLFGTGFPAAPALGAVSVQLNGVACAVTSASASAVTCITAPRPISAIQPVSINLTFAGEGAALYDASLTYFRYLDRWSALTTWKYGEPPVEGDTVIVPVGQAILVDLSPPELFLVLVEGDLVFEDARDLTFDATYITIDGGKFEVGSEAVPFLHSLVITLHGDRLATIEIPDVGAKGLTVMNMGDSMAGMEEGDGSGAMPKGYGTGMLELHGIPRKRVWCKLGAPSPAGSSLVTTAEDVDFAPGEIIIVTNTHDYTLTEEVVVASRPSPRTILLTAPLVNPHDCATVPAGQYGFQDVLMCGEVGLLSRNVVIQGDDGSAAQLFGVHTGAFHGGVYHVENVELRHCGQQGLLGRYCTHFHMTSDNWDSYVRFNSIHDTFQRAVTIHATNYALVHHNLAYNVFGHTIFVEDGVEQYNTIEENLVVYTKPCVICISSDDKPANFWMSSPTNFWRHNVAGGSASFGFWFELPNNPHGPSYTPDYCPVNMPLGEFLNNTAHSSSIGLRIYPQFFPTQFGCAGGGSAPQYFYNSSLFHNGQGMFHRNVGDLHHLNNRYVENQEDVAWKILDGVDYDWDPQLSNCLFICNTDPAGGCGGRAVTAPQREFFYATGLTIVNYWGAGALAGCLDCNSDEDYRQGGYTYRWGALTWVNTTVRTFWNPPYKCIFQDVDGTLTGHVNGTATPFYAYNNWPECPRDAVGTYGYATVCDGTFQVRRMQITGFQPSNLQFITLNVSSSAGWAPVPFRPKEFYGWAYALVDRHSYLTRWESLTDWRQLNLRYAEPAYINASGTEWTLLNFSWIDHRWSNLVQYGAGGAAAAVVPTLPAGQQPAPGLGLPIGASNLPDGNNTLSLLISTVGANASDPSLTYALTVTDLQCAPGGCPVPAPGSYGNATMWSDPASWPGGLLPVAGENVIINSSSYIIMDVNPPLLGVLTVNGRLDFMDSAPRSLQVTSIVNWGSFNIGSEEAPFQNTAEIVLFGTRTSPVVIVDDNLFLGNKVIANLGNMTIVGRQRTVPWTRLASTAHPGDLIIHLTESVEGVWLPGDRIALSPTEYNTSGLETVVVASVSGATVGLASPLTAWHFSGPAGANGSLAGGLPLRAAVALLTRNVVIRANLSSPTDGWGATLYNYVVQRPDPTNLGATISRWGVLDARHLEFRSGGKQSDPAFPGVSGSEHPAMGFQYGAFLFNTGIPATNPFNYLEGVVFSDSLNPAITAVAAKHIFVNGSVFHHTFRSGVNFDGDSTNVSIINSAFLGNLRSPDVNAPGQTPWIQPQSAVFLGSVASALYGNVVAGAVDAAYTLRGPPCGPNTSPTLLAVRNNEAHSVRIGVFLLVTPNGVGATGCLSLDGFSVWKASHLGVVTVDQVSSVLLSRLLVSDSHIGLSLNFIRFPLEELFGRVQDSTFIGTSLATRPCGEATTCMAVDEADVVGAGCNSVLGPAYARAGILSPQYTTRAKTCEVAPDGMTVCDPPNTIARMCSLPWEARYGTGLGGNQALYLARVTFIGFNGTDAVGSAAACGAASAAAADGIASPRMSHALVQNPTQTDDAVPMYSSVIGWEGVPPSGRFNFAMNDQTPPACAAGAGCDATNFVNFLDADGTLTGGGPGTLLGADPLLAWGSPRCTSSLAAFSTGISCPAAVFRTAIIAEVDLDAGHLNLGGLEVTRVEPGVVDLADNTTWPARTSLARGPIEEVCSKAMYSPVYPHMIVPNMTTQLYWPATEPNAIQYQFLSPSASEAAVVALFIQRPYSWQMFTQECSGCAPVEVDMFVPANSTDPTLPGLQDAPGTFLFNPQQRHLWFTVTGGNTARTYTLVRTPAIQLTMHLAIDAETFFGPDIVSNLATLLQINSWQIKVVDVQAGSVVVTTEIRDAQPTVLLNASNANNTAQIAAAVAQAQRMLDLAAAITTLANTGQFAVLGNTPVLSLSVLTLPVPVVMGGGGATGSTVAPITIIPSSPAAPPSKLSPGQTAGIVVGCILGVTLLLGIVVTHRNRQLARAQAASVLSAHKLGMDRVQPVDISPPLRSLGFGPVRGVSTDAETFRSNPQWRHQGAAATAAIAGRPGSTRVGYQPTLAGAATQRSINASTHSISPRVMPIRVAAVHPQPPASGPPSSSARQPLSQRNLALGSSRSLQAAGGRGSSPPGVSARV